MAGDQTLQREPKRACSSVGGVQADLLRSDPRLPAAHRPWGQLCQPLELPLSVAPVTPDPLETPHEVAGDAHRSMLPTGSTRVEVTGRAVQTKDSGAPALPKDVPPPSRNVAGALELSRTATCQALMYVASGLSKAGSRCGAAQCGPKYQGVSLCWVHRQVVELGRASLEQVLDGRRPANPYLSELSQSARVAAANRRMAR